MDAWLMSWLERNGEQALWLVPLLAFAEACVGLGLFVSGVLLLSAATLLYAQSLAGLPEIIVLAWAGGMLGDHSGYLTGRAFGPRLHHLPLAQRFRKNLLKAETMVQRHGAAAIFIGRFVPAIRSVVPVLVGISGLARLRYTLLDALACLLWALTLAALVAGLDALW
jgi:membrane-associated protein